MLTTRDSNSTLRHDQPQRLRQPVRHCQPHIALAGEELRQDDLRDACLFADLIDRFETRLHRMLEEFAEAAGFGQLRLGWWRICSTRANWVTLR